MPNTVCYSIGLASLSLLQNFSRPPVKQVPHAGYGPPAAVSKPSSRQAKRLTEKEKQGRDELAGSTAPQSQ
jgi:hypothetical protein